MSNRVIICQDKKRKPHTHTHTHTQRSSGTCGTMSKDLILLSSESKEQENRAEKVLKDFFQKGAKAVRWREVFHFNK